MLHAELRYPGPEIARIRKRRNSHRGIRRRVRGRKENAIHSADERRPFPVETNSAGPETQHSCSSAVHGLRKFPEEVGNKVPGRLGARNFGSIDLQPELRWPK